MLMRTAISFGPGVVTLRYIWYCDPEFFLLARSPCERCMRILRVLLMRPRNAANFATGYCAAVSACLPACLPACLLPACLPACLLACLPARLSLFLTRAVAVLRSQGLRCLSAFGSYDRFAARDEV